MALDIPKRLITDPHFHLWSPLTNAYANDPSIMIDKMDGLGGTLNAIYNDRVYDIQAFIRESNKYKLDKCVYLECSRDDTNDDNDFKGLKEVKEIQNIADKYGYPNGIIGYANLEVSNIEELIKEQIKCSNFRGIRPHICYNTKYKNRSWCDDGNILMRKEFYRGLKILQKYDIIFDCFIHPEQMKYIAIIACNFTKLRIVINHCALPYIENIDSVVTWLNGLKLLGKCDNIYMKMSGFPLFDTKYNKESMKFVIENIIKYFGINRCMFASDFPVDKPYGKYDDYWDNYIEICTSLGINETNIDKLIHLNAIEVYKLHENPKKKQAKL
mmetsp:Transcript_70477/g.86475  ORF Transcript_70477/g.86475 Transcript_70477/m.86475 type:complete len:328 (-) Transcript_70477:68-1051(-)